MQKKLIQRHTLLLLLITACVSGFSQTTYTFTTAGAINNVGPTQTQLNTAYASTNLNGLVTSSLGIQSWTVPVTGYYSIKAVGAQGGGPAAYAGLGASINGRYLLTSGTVLKIVVGQQGEYGTVGSGFEGGGGGGGSFIATASNSLLIAAGGGGGGTNNDNGGAGLITTNGGSVYNNGGGTGGNGGQNGMVNGPGGGGGGFYTDGENTNDPTTVADGGKAFLNGATGGASGVYNGYYGGAGGFGGGGGGWHNSIDRCGGGGGYSGGQGGTFSSSPAGIGGGGGSFNGGTNQVNSAGVNSGAGSVVITYLFLVDISQTAQILCNGQTTAALSSTLTGGTGPFTYSWTPSGGTGVTASNLSAGVYTLTVTDAMAHVASNTYTVTQPTVLAAATSNTNVSCFGGFDGKAMVTVTGGTPSYSYTWAPSGGNAALATGLSMGGYTCSISDANGCTLSKILSVGQPAAALSATTVQANVSCFGGSNGTAGVTVSGGTTAYSYSWTPSGGTGASISGRTAGTYTTTITDAKGCTLTKTFTLTQPPALTITAVSNTSVSCNGGANGAATASVSGGTPGYTYDWTPGTPTGDGTPSITGITAGTWTCTTTDANSCTASTLFTINQPSALVATNTFTNVSCNGGSTGSASVTASGGTGVYTYSWSPAGGTAALASGLPAGTYTVAIKDANLCLTTQVLAISQPSVLSAVAGATNVTCNGGSDGAASVNISGGTPAYTYSWSPSAGTAATITGLAVGTYTNKVTDANGCVLTTTIAVTQPVPLAVTASAGNSMICIGNSTTLNGGGASTYTWTSGVTNGAVFSPTATASYTVSGTSVAGCTGTAVATITVNALPSVTASVTNSVICSGTSVTLNGTGAATYTWTGGATNGIAFNPPVTATYTLTGTSTAGCTSTNTAVQTITVNSSPTVTVSATVSAICAGSSVTLNAGGAITYTWTNGVTDGTAFTPTSTAAYTVTGTGANGCMNTSVKTITVNSLPSVVISTSRNTICTGETALLTVTGASTYTWSTAQQSGGIAVSPTVTTSYSVTGTDANGCSKAASFTQNVSLCTGIAQLTNSSPALELNVYPNPNRGMFTAKSSTDLMIYISDELGRVLQSLQLNASNNYEANIDVHAQGIYFITGRNATQSVKQKIVVIQ